MQQKRVLTWIESELWKFAKEYANVHCTSAARLVRDHLVLLQHGAEILNVSTFFQFSERTHFQKERETTNRAAFNTNNRRI